MNKEASEQLTLDDIFVIRKNQKGVLYLADLYDEKVIAKKCTKCDSWHFMNGFNKAGKGFAGSMSYCRDCHNQRDKDARAEAKAIEKELHGIVTDEMLLIRKNWF